MLKKILPLVLLIIGAGAGAGAGLFLRPAPEAPPSDAMADENEAVKEPEEADSEDQPVEEPQVEYVKMNNQFVVPIVTDAQVSALVVLSLSVEVPLGQKSAVYEREPKLRDSFLQVLFNHANRGGFNGAFTSSTNMKALRTALREVAQRDLGELVEDVLIQEIARQDY